MYSTHHSIHHLPGHGRKSNLGHMTTVWDRIVGTYEDPEFADYGWHQYDIVIRICNVFNRIYDFICPDRSSIWKNKNICDHNKSEWFYPFHTSFFNIQLLWTIFHTKEG